jgi:hypothetical protein
MWVETRGISECLGDEYEFVKHLISLTSRPERGSQKSSKQDYYSNHPPSRLFTLTTPHPQTPHQRTPRDQPVEIFPCCHGTIMHTRRTAHMIRTVQIHLQCYALYESPTVRPLIVPWRHGTIQDRSTVNAFDQEPMITMKNT